MAKSQSWSEPRGMELRSMVQLAELMAREYVAEMKGEEVLYTPPIPVDAFRPVKKRRGASETGVGAAGPQGIQHGNCRRVAERSAFTSVTPHDAGGDSDSSDSSDASLPPSFRAARSAKSMVKCILTLSCRRRTQRRKRTSTLRAAPTARIWHSACATSAFWARTRMKSKQQFNIKKKGSLFRHST